MFISWFSFFFFKQKTAYEMRISDWSSDVCSSDLLADAGDRLQAQFYVKHLQRVQQRRWAAVDALAAIREAKGPYLACVTAECGGFSIIRPFIPNFEESHGGETRYSYGAALTWLNAAIRDTLPRIDRKSTRLHSRH